MFARPSRRLQAGLFLATVAGLVVIPLVNHFKGDAIGRPNMDYPLWYLTGQAFVHGEPLYPTDPDEWFPFMYPPFAAMALGGLSLPGPTGMLVLLLLLNAASLAAAVELTVRAVAGRSDVPLLVRTLPATVSIFLVADMFKLGQPNLGLYCLLLGGLMLVRAKYETAGGLLFAVAAALKAFPVLVLAYLVYRRAWRASIAMVLGIVALLVLAPAPVRGFERNLDELKTWADGMLFRQSAAGHGQRPEQSTSWRNQSLSAVAHRFLRPADAEADSFGEAPPLFVNVADIGYRNASLAIIGLSAALGLAFVSAMPARRDRTPRTDALEFGMLLTLITLGTPYAFSYYFVWLLYPFTVCGYHALRGRDAADRRIGGITGVAALVLYAAGAPLPSGERLHHLLNALGNFFWCSLVLLAGMACLMARARRRNAVRVHPVLMARPASEGPGTSNGHGGRRTAEPARPLACASG